ncbi:MAG: hypothetical protein M1828_005501 [Chrysothrix sp. TS-e1954]|nr:MAG: hypothetical protein M1828_005501 [Chrysothrix sp. TS-e1954]
MSTNVKGVCQFYGSPVGCSFGDRCKFLHPTGTGGAPARTKAPGSSGGSLQHPVEGKVQARSPESSAYPQAPGLKLYCKAWSTPEGCTTGPNCEYGHHGPGHLSNVDPYIRARSTLQTCIRWRDGLCKYGVDCMFAHYTVEDKLVQEDLGQAFATLNPGSMIGRQQQISLSEVHDIASYSWSETEPYRIVIPGMPRRFREPAYPLNLEPDNRLPGGHEISSKYPFRYEPVVISAATMMPSLQISDMEVVTSTAALCTLMSVAANDSTKTLRVDVELLGSTMFLTDWSNHNLSRQPENRHFGYGQNFVDACTTPLHDMHHHDAVTHQRIKAYKIFDLQFLVTYKSDAFDCECHAVSTQSAQVANLNRESSVEKQKTCSKLSTIVSGEPLHESCLLAIRSRGAWHGEIHFYDEFLMTQLWLSQTQRFYLGRYKRQIHSCPPVHDVSMSDPVKMEEDMTQVCDEWCQANQPMLQRFAKLLHGIKNATKAKHKAVQQRKFSIIARCNVSPPSVTVHFRNDDMAALPDAMVQKIWASNA